MSNKTLTGLLAIILLFVAPYFALIAYYAYFDKDVIYLRGGDTPWMLNPDDVAVKDGFPDDIPATYVLSINIASPVSKARIAIEAVKSHVLAVNDEALSDEQETYRAGWKRAREYDITNYLRQGNNNITVRVKSDHSITALRTQGEVVFQDGRRLDLGPSEHWAVTPETAFEPQQIFPGEFKPVELLGHDSYIDMLKDGRYWPGSLVLFGAAGLLVAGLFLLPGVFMGLDKAVLKLVPESLKDEKGRRALRAAFMLAVLSVLAVVLYNNFMKYPAECTGDFPAHVEYLRHFLHSWRVPLADEGFQMYNPPLYYLLSAVVCKVFGLSDVVRSAQLVNTVSTFLTVLLVYPIVKRAVGDAGSALAAFAVSAFLPVLLYKAPSVSGESLFTFVTAVLFYLWLRYLDRPAAAMALAAGLVTGISFMNRFTALFPMLGVLAGFAWLVFREAGRRRERLGHAGLYLLATAAVCGWYYARNFVHFHAFFPINGTPDVFFFRQIPGFRNFDFYTNVSALLVNNPISKSNVLESFIAGCYSTFWYDGQRFFTVTEDFKLAFTAMALGLLPTALIVSGAARAAADGTSDGVEAGPVFLLGCLVTTSLAAAAFTLGSFKYPYYSFPKAFYLLFLVPPVMCFMGLGIKRLAARAGWSFISAWLGALCFFALEIFTL